MRRGVLDPIEVGEPALDRQIALPALDVPLEQRELAVPAVYARAGAPAQELRQPVDQRHDQEQQRHEQDHQPLDIARHEERKVALQQARPEAHVAVGLDRDRQVDEPGVGEGRAGLEVALSAVQLAGGVDQEIGDRRREARARDQHRLGAEEANFVLGNAQRQIDGPRRQ